MCSLYSLCTLIEVSHLIKPYFVAVNYLGDVCSAASSLDHTRHIFMPLQSGIAVQSHCAFYLADLV